MAHRGGSKGVLASTASCLGRVRRTVDQKVFKVQPELTDSCSLKRPLYETDYFGLLLSHYYLHESHFLILKLQAVVDPYCEG